MSAEMKCRHWAVVPAAGAGRRMDADIPKQYLVVAGQAVLQHTIERMLGWGFLEQVIVALGPDDNYWCQLPVSGDSRVLTVSGGNERCDSVLAGLEALSPLAAADDWVWVHDACRPCIALTDVQRLRTAVAEDAVGGLLAVPVAETLKRSDSQGRVAETVDRKDLWLAQTPQLFRFGLLRDALLAARRAGQVVTDEAAAIEYAGFQAQLVMGDPVNIKLTRPADIDLIAATLGRGVD
jgi:2-C-methyl-D-erythritol 4-phosphate cytidylyltransferase